nr:radical SAM protein [bacterium]
MGYKIGVVSLGCNKNRVDTEHMLGYLTSQGHTLTNDPRQADVLIVNTCGFIGPAREEAIDTLKEMATYRPPLKLLIATGCLAQRDPAGLWAAVPEIDAILGVGQYDRIGDVIDDAMQAKRPCVVGSPHALGVSNPPRVLTTPPYLAYLKVADGCDNGCSYCTIPTIRGPYRSRSFESVLQEAQGLVEKGVKELVVVAQDTTRYGMDLYGKPRLAQLLVALADLSPDVWVRFLYAYPEMVDGALLR